MILYQSWEVFASFLFYFGVKIFCIATEMMKQSTLTSIPERNEFEEMKSSKWVAKKKHEVLKAKYKCLKKLFQIYDASLIGILPETSPIEYADDTKRRRRQKRSHRTKTDACAGTSEISSGDVTQSICQSECDRQSIATAVIRDLKISCSTQFEDSKSKIETNESNHSIEFESNDSAIEKVVHPVPYLILNEQRKLTRFQCFVQRILGIRRDVRQDAHAASDSLRDRRRRRGLRFRRIRRANKTKSDSDIKDLRSPAILSCVQSAQRSCLMDTTSRQCPIIGCNMISYGIINYNDHLNLCHFKNRKFVCHYCHAGFDKDIDKALHENEHIGINKLTSNLSNLSTGRQSDPRQTSSNRQQNAKSTETVRQKASSDTQTDPDQCIPDDKLKKIVSFFEKISNPDDIVAQIRQNRSSTNIQTDTDSESKNNSCTSLRNGSNLDKRRMYEPCFVCGKKFYCRRQLSLHVDLEHSIHQLPKRHSVAGDMNTRRDFSRDRSDLSHNRSYLSHGNSDLSHGNSDLSRGNSDLSHGNSDLSHGNSDVSRGTRELLSQNGRINVLSIVSSSEQPSNQRSSSITPSLSEDTIGKSSVTLTCDPSTNIIYSSMETVKKQSIVGSLVKKVMSYRWEPETEIVRV